MLVAEVRGPVTAESNSVIETKPVVPVDNSKQIVISPSKTQPSQEKKPSDPPKQASSVVVVQANPSEKTEIKSLPSSKVNVKGGVTSIVNVMNAPDVSSKVEIVAQSAVIKR